MKQLRITAAVSYGFIDRILGSSPVIKEDEIEEKTELIDQEVDGQGAYFDEEIEEIVRSAVPIMIDGSMTQLDRPSNEQDILLLLPGKKLPCVVQIESMEDFKTYRISLKK